MLITRDTLFSFLANRTARSRIFEPFPAESVPARYSQGVKYNPGMMEHFFWVDNAEVLSTNCSDILREFGRQLFLFDGSDWHRNLRLISGMLARFFLLRRSHPAFIHGHRFNWRDQGLFRDTWDADVEVEKLDESRDANESVSDLCFQPIPMDPASMLPLHELEAFSWHTPWDVPQESTRTTKTRYKQTAISARGTGFPMYREQIQKTFDLKADARILKCPGLCPALSNETFAIARDRVSQVRFILPRLEIASLRDKLPTLEIVDSNGFLNCFVLNCALLFWAPVGQAKQAVHSDTLSIALDRNEGKVAFISAERQRFDYLCRDWASEAVVGRWLSSELGD